MCAIKLARRRHTQGSDHKLIVVTGHVEMTRKRIPAEFVTITVNEEDDRLIGTITQR